MCVCVCVCVVCVIACVCLCACVCVCVCVFCVRVCVCVFTHSSWYSTHVLPSLYIRVFLLCWLNQQFPRKQRYTSTKVHGVTNHDSNFYSNHRENVRSELMLVGNKIQSVPRSKHSLSVMQTSQLMLCREIIAVCSQIHTKHINTLCGQNVELLNVKLAVHNCSDAYTSYY
jgi:hypothetical protein